MALSADQRSYKCSFPYFKRSRRCNPKYLPLFVIILSLPFPPMPLLVCVLSLSPFLLIPLRTGKGCRAPQAVRRRLRSAGCEGAHTVPPPLPRRRKKQTHRDGMETESACTWWTCALTTNRCSMKWIRTETAPSPSTNSFRHLSLPLPLSLFSLSTSLPLSLLPSPYLTHAYIRPVALTRQSKTRWPPVCSAQWRVTLIHTCLRHRQRERRERQRSREGKRKVERWKREREREREITRRKRKRNEGSGRKDRLAHYSLSIRCGVQWTAQERS